MSDCLCGRPIAAGEVRCPRCGRQVGPAAPWGAAPPPAGGELRAARRRGATLALLVLVVVVAVGGYVATLHLGGVGPSSRAAYLPAPVSVHTPPPTPRPLGPVAVDSLTRVVTVEALTDDGERFGTGWLLDGGADFVTNAHVVQGQRALRIIDRAGSAHPAALLGSDAGQDVAVLRSTGRLAADPLPLDTSDASTLPEQVVVLASPRATMHGDTTVEQLLARHRTVSVAPEQTGRTGTDPIVYDDMLLLGGEQIYQGNSGGPVLDASGRVVGIVTAASSSHPEAYAIPLSRVIGELHSLAARPAPAG